MAHGATPEARSTIRVSLAGCVIPAVRVVTHRTAFFLANILLEDDHQTRMALINVYQAQHSNLRAGHLIDLAL
jgi:hypothetical protein